MATITIQAQTAAVNLPRFFSDGMVLQRETNAPFWGFADAGSKIEVTASWDNKKVETTTPESGKWMVELATPKAGGPYTIKVNETTINNVKIGEVWFCSGQSNMKMRLGEADKWTVQDDNNTNICFFEVPVARSSEPLSTISEGEWRSGVIDNNMQHISAVGYYFARRLQEELKIPIGMIGFYEGGTHAEEWTSPEVFKTLSQDVQSALPSDREAGSLYNAMVYPVLPYKGSGFIWYQGENNNGYSQTYSPLLKAMVEGWRKDFKNDYLPFYIVQLTTFSTDFSDFRYIQQQLSEEIPNSGIAVTIDCGDQGNIHPTNKYPVGTRLGDMALAKVYGKDKPAGSPTYREMKVEGNKIRIYFDHAEKGLKITSGNYPFFFEIAGSDNVFEAANARIEGNTILLWSDNIESPTQARYFKKNYAEPNLFSEDGYPVAPFVTK